jgi:hypothetical protein
MDAVTWGMVVAFLRWSYETYQSEAQLRLFYSEKMGLWKAAPMPQHVGTGMYVEEIKGHPDRIKVWDEVDMSLYQEAGTVHHHCSCSAFQSGTDANDEKLRIGLHITLGHMSDTAVDLHARAIFKGLQYPVELLEWLDAPDIESLRAPVAIGFPDTWKERLIVKPPPVQLFTPRGWESAGGECDADGDQGAALERWRMVSLSSSQAESITIIPPEQRAGQADLPWGDDGHEDPLFRDLLVRDKAALEEEVLPVLDEIESTPALASVFLLDNAEVDIGMLEAFCELYHRVLSTVPDGVRVEEVFVDFCRRIVAGRSDVLSLVDRIDEYYRTCQEIEEQEGWP